MSPGILGGSFQDAESVTQMLIFQLLCFAIDELRLRRGVAVMAIYRYNVEALGADRSCRGGVDDCAIANALVNPLARHPPLESVSKKRRKRHEKKTRLSSLSSGLQCRPSSAQTTRRP